jgi:hypothetical protein
LAITVFTPALAGCLLLLSWLQHRRVTALALWGSGFIIASVATTLIIVLRGTIPNFWSIIVDRGSFNSPQICGTHVPVEEPSTASKADVAIPGFID